MRAAQRRPATRAESAKALEAVRTLFAVTPRMKAEARFERAKAEYDAATRALIAQEPDAIVRADVALTLLNEARAALAAIDAEATE
jgi:hypothetical protein